MCNKIKEVTYERHDETHQPIGVHLIGYRLVLVVD